MHDVLATARQLSSLTKFCCSSAAANLLTTIWSHNMEMALSTPLKLIDYVNYKDFLNAMSCGPFLKETWDFRAYHIRNKHQVKLLHVSQSGTPMGLVLSIVMCRRKRIE